MTGCVRFLVEPPYRLHPTLPSHIGLIFPRGFSCRITETMDHSTQRPQLRAHSSHEPWHTSHDSEHNAAMDQSTHTPRLREYDSRGSQHIAAAMAQNTGNARRTQQQPWITAHSSSHGSQRTAVAPRRYNSTQVMESVDRFGSLQVSFRTKHQYHSVAPVDNKSTGGSKHGRTDRSCPSTDIICPP
jgi:hypothetical protein